MDKFSKKFLINQMRFLVNDLSNELNRLEREENPTYQRIHDVESSFSIRSKMYRYHLKKRRE